MRFVRWALGLGLVVGLLSGPVMGQVGRGKSDAPPRKVIVGTAIFGPFGEYPGLERRIEELSGLVDRLAAEAKRKYPGRGLDLAVLTETCVTPREGDAAARARPLEGPVADAFGALARKHGCYLVVPMDLAETGSDGGPIASNAAVLFDRSGKVAGIYRKAHPVAVAGTDELERGITPGAATPVFDCDFGKLGVQICWDVQFAEDWDALGKAGAEIVAWPTASPATILTAGHAARNRYYVVSSNWRDNATVYGPNGIPVARIEDPAETLVQEIDLSFALLSWAPHLEDGEAFTKRYGDNAGYRYSRREDNGLFWSNDPKTPIGQMVRELGLEELDAQVARNRRLYERP